MKCVATGPYVAKHIACWAWRQAVRGRRRQCVAPKRRVHCGAPARGWRPRTTEVLSPVAGAWWGSVALLVWPALANNLLACVWLLLARCRRLVGLHYEAARGWRASAQRGLGPSSLARPPPRAWAPPRPFPAGLRPESDFAPSALRNQHHRPTSGVPAPARPKRLGVSHLPQPKPLVV